MAKKRRHRLKRRPFFSHLCDNCKIRKGHQFKRNQDLHKRFNGLKENNKKLAEYNIQLIEEMKVLIQERNALERDAVLRKFEEAEKWTQVVEELEEQQERCKRLLENIIGLKSAPSTSYVMNRSQLNKSFNLSGCMSRFTSLEPEREVLRSRAQLKKQERYKEMSNLTDIVESPSPVTDLHSSNEPSTIARISNTQNEDLCAVENISPTVGTPNSLGLHSKSSPVSDQQPTPTGTLERNSSEDIANLTCFRLTPRVEIQKPRKRNYRVSRLSNNSFHHIQSPRPNWRPTLFENVPASPAALQKTSPDLIPQFAIGKRNFKKRIPVTPVHYPAVRLSSLESQRESFCYHPLSYDELFKDDCELSRAFSTCTSVNENSGTVQDARKSSRFSFDKQSLATDVELTKDSWIRASDVIPERETAETVSKRETFLVKNPFNDKRSTFCVERKVTSSSKENMNPQNEPVKKRVSNKLAGRTSNAKRVSKTKKNAPKVKSKDLELENDASRDLKRKDTNDPYDFDVECENLGKECLFENAHSNRKSVDKENLLLTATKQQPRRQSARERRPPRSLNFYK